MVGGTLLLHLLFYLLGYYNADNFIRNEYDLFTAFTDNWVILLFIILLLILLIGFGFRYYTHNPVSALYPLDRSYMIRQFVFLVFFVLAIMLVYFSFNQAIADYTRDHYKLSEVKEDIRKTQNALPFIQLLERSKNPYYISNRAYPKPFPLSTVTDKPISEETGYNRENIEQPLDTQKPYVILGGNRYQFGKWIFKEINKCETTSDFDSIQDVSQVYGLAEYSLYNFVPDNDYQIIGIDSAEWFEDFHQKLKTRNRDALLEDINWFCKTHLSAKDRSKFNPAWLLDRAMRTLDGEWTMPTEDDLYLGYDYMRYYNNLDEAFDDFGFASLGDYIVFFLIAAMLISIIIIFSKFVPGIPLIVSFIIANALFFLLVLIAISYFSITDTNSIDVSFRFLWIALIYCLVILGLHYYLSSLNRKQKRVYYLSISTVAATVALSILIYLLVWHLSAQVIDCGGYPSYQYLWEIRPWHFVVLILLSSSIVFRQLIHTRIIPE